MNIQRLAAQPPLIMNLRGSQAEMGRQFGELAAAAGGHREVLEYYPTMARNLLLQGFARPKRGMVTSAILTPAMELLLNRISRFRPDDLRERTAQALKSAGIPAYRAKYLQIMDVFQNSVGMLSKAGLVKMQPGSPAAHAFVPACSSAMVWGEASVDGQMLHARNFDFPGVGVWDEAPIVVFCSPSEGVRYGYISTRGGDIPGVTAFNEAGLTVDFHTRLHKDVGFDGIGAVDLGHEIVRTARTIDEAIAVIEKFTIASTWGIAISSAKENRAIIAETSRKMLRIVEHQAPNYAVNTNHYYHPDLQHGELDTSPAFRAHSLGREKSILDFLRKKIDQGGVASADLERMLGLMYDPSDPTRERAMGSQLGQGITVKSVVIKPSAGQIRLSVGRAPTGWGPYITVPMEWPDDVGSHEFDVSTLLQTKQSRKAASLAENSFVTSATGAQAYEHFRQAGILDLTGGSQRNEKIREHMHAAESLVPEDLAFQFLNGVLCLEDGDWLGAYHKFAAGMEAETVPFRTGQFSAWAARAAQASGKTREAAALREQLCAIDDRNLHSLQAEARRESSAPISAAKLKSVAPSFMLVDAALAT